MRLTAVQETVSWPIVLAVALLAAASGAGRDAHPLVLRVDETTTNRQFAKRAMGLLGEHCPFAWGDVTEGARTRPGVLAWANGQIEGWFVCGQDFERVLRDPRHNAFLMVTYADGALWGSHPSDDDRWPIEIPDQPSEERWGLLAAVGTDLDPDSLVLPKLRAVRWLPRLAQTCLLF